MTGMVITGGTGLIGRRLTALCQSTGIRVHHLSRRPGLGDVPAFHWDPAQGKLDAKCFEGIDTVVHLAGESVASGRWTAKRKERILSSRISGVRTLYNCLSRQNPGIRNFISASAIGYYGFNPVDDPVTEDSPPGTDFLARVCMEWEAEACRFEQLGIRAAAVRTGLVLSSEGGALPALTRPVRWGLGAVLGTGQQMYSWIHIDDLCRLMIHLARQSELRGPFNAVAPDAVTNREMTEAIARRLHRPLWLPAAPAFVLKAALGEMAGMILGGGRVAPQKILNSGFRFEYATLNKALDNLIH